MKNLLFVFLMLSGVMATAHAGNQDVEIIIEKSQNINDVDRRVRYLVSKAERALEQKNFEVSEALAIELQKVDQNSEEAKSIQDTVKQQRNRFNNDPEYRKEVEEIRRQAQEQVVQIEKNKNKKVALIQGEAIDEAEEVRLSFINKSREIRGEAQKKLRNLQSDDVGEIKAIQNNAAREIARLKKELSEEVDHILKSTSQDIREIRKERMQESKALVAKSVKLKNEARANQVDIINEANEDIKETIVEANSEISETYEGAQENLDELRKKEKFSLANNSEFKIYGKSNEAAIVNAAYRNVTNILGSEIETTNGKDLGHIVEIIVNPDSGKFEHVILSYGGFMGIGDKRFAIAWSNLTPDTKDENKFLIDVDENYFKYNEGLKDEKWVMDSSNITLSF